MKTVFGFGLVASVTAYKPEAVSYTDLLKGNNVAAEMVVKGLSSEGMISVSGIPGFQKLKEQTLIRAAACAAASEKHEDAIALDFEDGTKRMSLATKTDAGVTAEVFGQNALASECMLFGKKQGEFRSLVDSTVEAFLAQLDAGEGLDSSRRVLLSEKDGSNEISSFGGLGKAGNQLEHFHTYVKNTESEKIRGSPTVEVHVDQGLLIALAPALMIESGRSLSGAGHGFMVQTSDGEIVEPDFTGTDLFFMVGDGANWINDKLFQKLRPVPHMVTVPSSQGVRSWYGRMILPPKNTFLTTVGETFGKIHTVGQEGTRDLAGAACSYGFELVSRNLQSCGEGTINCWHQCMAVSCDTAYCANPDGSDCSDGHDCAPQCA